MTDLVHMGIEVFVSLCDESCSLAPDCNITSDRPGQYPQTGRSRYKLKLLGKQVERRYCRKHFSRSPTRRDPCLDFFTDGAVWYPRAAF